MSLSASCARQEVWPSLLTPLTTHTVIHWSYYKLYSVNIEKTYLELLLCKEDFPSGLISWMNSQESTTFWENLYSPLWLLGFTLQILSFCVVCSNLRVDRVECDLCFVCAWSSSSEIVLLLEGGLLWIKCKSFLFKFLGLQMENVSPRTATVYYIMSEDEDFVLQTCAGPTLSFLLWGTDCGIMWANIKQRIEVVCENFLECSCLSQVCSS